MTDKQNFDMPATEPERKSFGKRAIVLTSWASVATALLLIVLIGGAIYVNKENSTCDMNEGNVKTKTDHYKDGEEKEDVYMDDQLKTQLYIKRNKDGAIVLIADVDYNRKISATYVAGADQCYLTAGEDMDWYEAWYSPKLNMSAVKEDEDKAHYFNLDVNNRVTDMSLLPRYIRPFCEGKQIYWITPDETQESGKSDSSLARQKRATACYRVCYAATHATYGAGYLCYYYDCAWSYLYAIFYY